MQQMEKLAFLAKKIVWTAIMFMGTVGCAILAITLTYMTTECADPANKTALVAMESMETVLNVYKGIMYRQITRNSAKHVHKTVYHVIVLMDNAMNVPLIITYGELIIKHAQIASRTV